MLVSQGQTKPPYDRDDLELLGHYAVESPELGDRKVIEQLLIVGADLTKPRHTIHFLYFPTEALATYAAKALNYAGYEAHECEQSLIPSTNRWPVLAEKTDVVYEAIMDRAYLPQCLR